MTGRNLVNNEIIFQYLKPTINTKLRDFNEDDITDMIRLINKYYLVFRETLGYNDKVTYGFELEFENPDKDKISDSLIDNCLIERWFMHKDISLINGAEISSPILTDCNSNWAEFLKVCQILRENAIIKETCSGHIHIGTHVLGDKKTSWQNFLLLWAVYENIIFRFTAGEYINPRQSVIQYANPVGINFMDAYFTYDWDQRLTLKSLRRALGYRNNPLDRYQAINLSNATRRNGKGESNTIEFRTPNGTLEPVIWQNNLNLFVALINYAKSTKFDMDTILKRYCIMSNRMDICLYGQIYLEQAIELVDLIFDKNIDKVYFLRQYLKGFQETELNDEFVKARTFIRNK